MKPERRGRPFGCADLELLKWTLSAAKVKPARARRRVDRSMFERLYKRVKSTENNWVERTLAGEADRSS